jgi:hypothetical protein
LGDEADGVDIAGVLDLRVWSLLAKGIDFLGIAGRDVYNDM